MNEIYNMTQDRYLKEIYNTLDGHSKYRWDEQIKNNKIDNFSFLSICIAKHKVAIYDAIWEGINVSDNILKDYPDIINEFEKEINENKNIQ